MSRLIDADELIEALDSFILDDVTDVHGDTVREILERLPTIEERKKGKWIKKDCDLLYCSECDLPSLHPWPYCERCGADMRGEDRETDLRRRT